jgi:hypothetical protein
VSKSSKRYCTLVRISVELDGHVLEDKEDYVEDVEEEPEECVV